jgi:DNA-binding SARP family transcriptional activator
VEFRILGPLEVLRDGDPVVVRGAKERALLAVLLVHANEVVSTERLIDELWGERVPRTARKSIQVRVAGLRGQVGRVGVLTHSGGYQVRVDRDRFDLYRFEDLVMEGRRPDHLHLGIGVLKRPRRHFGTLLRQASR